MEDSDRLVAPKDFQSINLGLKLRSVDSSPALRGVIRGDSLIPGQNSTKWEIALLRTGIYGILTLDWAGLKVLCVDKYPLQLPYELSVLFLFLNKTV